MCSKSTGTFIAALVMLQTCVLCVGAGILQEVAERTDTVMGVEGEAVKLPCDIRPPSPDDEVALILWYKDESTTPLYSLDSRRRGLHLAKHASAPEVSDRVHLLTNESPSYLRLQKLRPEDEGEYKCRVDFKIARSRNVVVILEIITPPKTPVIKNSKGSILQRVTGPHNEGSRLYLRCDVEGGKPPPAVTWWKDSILLDETYQVFPKSNIVRNELLIPALYRTDLHSLYTCQAANNNVSNPVTASVTVDMNLPPVEVVIEDKNRPLSANKPVELVCRAGGSRPPANITWDIGRGPLKGSKAKISSEGNITTGKLTFIPKIEDKGKNVTCRAENSLLRGKAIFDIWTIDVHYIPQLTLRLGSKLRHSHIQEGKDVYLECSVVSNPPETDVGWRFEGRELHTNKSAGIIVSSRSLVLQKVKKTNRGRYTCTADNSEGRGESSPLYLRVQYTPICKPNQKTLYGVARHEPVKVTCDVEADPSKTNFTWRFNNSVESLDIMTFVNEDSRSIATYIPRTEYDYGTLLCWARNVIGMQKDPCVFTVIPAGPPDPVTNCSASNETEDSLLVRCQEGYDGGLQQLFILEVYDSTDMSLVVNMTNTEKPYFTAYGLPSGTSFVAVVYAENSKQRSKGVVVRANTLATPESLTQRDNHWPSSFSPVLIVLISVLSVLVVVALTIVCVVKTRSRHPPEKDMQKHGQDKSMTPLRQDTDDRREGIMMPTLLDIEDKGPDVIPGMELGIEPNKENESRKPDIQRDDMPRERRIICSSSPSPTQLNAVECPSEWGMHHKPMLKQVPSPTVPQMPQKSMQPLLEYISPTQQQQLPTQLIASPSSSVRAEWTLPRSSTKIKNRQTDV